MCRLHHNLLEMRSTLSRLKYFNTIKIHITIVALFGLVNSGEPGWELKCINIEDCCIKINFGEIFKIFAFYELLN